MLFLRIASRRFATSASVSSKRESDKFGTLSERGSQQLRTIEIEQTVPEDDDGYDQIEMTVGDRKNAYYYKQNISLYSRQGKLGIKKALELFRQMKAVDRLTPDQGNFSVLIYGCAKVGYTQKAFELYEEHLKYLSPKQRPSQAIVACLFNACSECPFPQYGLERLDWIKNQLSNQFSYIYNRTHYNAQIKAYGKLGQFQKAADTVQEMIQAQIVPDTRTFNMLLIGCASDKVTGLAHAIRVFRRLKQYNLEPNVDTYKLLLRCVRHCEIGPVKNIQHILGEMPALPEPAKKKSLRSKGHKEYIKSPTIIQEWTPLDNLPSITESETSLLTTICSEDDSLHSQPLRLEDRIGPEKHDHSESAPNLLRDSSLDLMARVESLNTNELRSIYGRLLLIGDVKGVLDMMKSDGLAPDAKVFGLLLSCLPRRWSYDQEILDYMEKYPIIFDTRIYDMMIERQGSKYEDPTRLTMALRIVEIMQERGVQPSISTFEALALCCGGKKDAQKLLSDMGDITPTYTLMKNLFINARYSDDIYYSINLIKKCIELKLRPDKALVERLETKKLEFRNLILKHERDNLEGRPSLDRLTDGFHVYSAVMENYLRQFRVQDEIHPWSQYKVDNSYGRKGYSEFVDEMREKHDRYWNSKHQNRTMSSL